MKKFKVKLSNHGQLFEIEVLARTQTEAKQRAQAQYPDCRVFEAKEVR